MAAYAVALRTAAQFSEPHKPLGHVLSPAQRREVYAYRQFLAS